MYSSFTTDASFLKIEPDVLTADVGAKAHFSCQGNAFKEIIGEENTRDNDNRLGTIT
jgi:hypothetical protein